MTIRRILAPSALACLASAIRVSDEDDALARPADSDAFVFTLSANTEFAPVNGANLALMFEEALQVTLSGFKLTNSENLDSKENWLDIKHGLKQWTGVDKMPDLIVVGCQECKWVKPEKLPAAQLACDWRLGVRTEKDYPACASADTNDDPEEAAEPKKKKEKKGGFFSGAFNKLNKMAQGAMHGEREGKVDDHTVEAQEAYLVKTDIATATMTKPPNTNMMYQAVLALGTSPFAKATYASKDAKQTDDPTRAISGNKGAILAVANISDNYYVFGSTHLDAKNPKTRVGNIELIQKTIQKTVQQKPYIGVLYGDMNYRIYGLDPNGDDSKTGATTKKDLVASVDPQMYWRMFSDAKYHGKEPQKLYEAFKKMDSLTASWEKNPLSTESPEAWKAPGYTQNVMPTYKLGAPMIKFDKEGKYDIAACKELRDKVQGGEGESSQPEGKEQEGKATEDDGPPKIKDSTAGKDSPESKKRSLLQEGSPENEPGDKKPEAKPADDKPADAKPADAKPEAKPDAKPETRAEDKEPKSGESSQKPDKSDDPGGKPTGPKGVAEGLAGAGGGGMPWDKCYNFPADTKECEAPDGSSVTACADIGWLDRAFTHGEMQVLAHTTLGWSGQRSKEGLGDHSPLFFAAKFSLAAPKLEK
eukprot:TRINITY_DN100422_c0_g1_i1.p1 TRINITY_DN100422_c0_g1~~TRINITY_DN100422_c0_g1_i1.p1  ORF type:complete len:646 (+),score=187.12 TRINITY_DN100422_c0_g1_i1:110-2047(+)